MTDDERIKMLEDRGFDVRYTYASAVHPPFSVVLFGDRKDVMGRKMSVATGSGLSLTKALDVVEKRTLMARRAGGVTLWRFRDAKNESGHLGPYGEPGDWQVLDGDEPDPKTFIGQNLDLIEVQTFYPDEAGLKVSIRGEVARLREEAAALEMDSAQDAHGPQMRAEARTKRTSAIRLEALLDT